ncbi:TolC family protein [Desulfatirhabdium butyrativorans]|uniref:TolC family protein n=1 Tax=Desulfatirhabdium butyrativorans TaxID=340467 RepID=UPI00146FA855|nr:TolC family protein [Desulfatirhabdium butyrativorans]
MKWPDDPRRVMTILTLALVLFGIVHSRTGAAENEKQTIEARITGGSPSLADLLSYAYQSNPEIQAAKSSWRVAIEKYRVETGYPDPVLTTTYWPDDPARNWSEKRFEIMFSQTIPFPGKLAAAGRVVESESQIAKLELDRTIRDVSINVRESFHELQYIREAIRIAAHNREAVEHLRQIGETSHAQDRTTLFDVLKAQSQSGQVQYDILLLQELERTEITRLNALLNRPPDAPIASLMEEQMRPLVYDLTDIYALAEAQREEIRSAAVAVDKTRAEADVAHFQNLPEFMVGFKYEYNAPQPPNTSGTDMYGVQFGVSLPIWWDKNAGRQEAARAGTERATALVRTRINEARALIRETFFRLKNAERLVALYRDQLLPQAQKAMETAEIWNREGQGSLSDFLETEAVWYNFQLALARSRADYGKYLAKLEGIVGISLTQKSEIAQPLQQPEATP